VVHLLEAAAQVLRGHVAAGDRQHRRVGVGGIGYTRQSVGGPRPGGDDRNTETAGEAGVGVGGVSRRLLVAHVDDPDPFTDTAVDDRKDVPTGEHEHGVDALALQRLGEGMPCLDLGQWGPNVVWGDCRTRESGSQ
jgi:hypothetical protein